jgi:hypothetical protein
MPLTRHLREKICRVCLLSAAFSVDVVAFQHLQSSFNMRRVYSDWSAKQSRDDSVGLVYREGRELPPFVCKPSCVQRLSGRHMSPMGMHGPLLSPKQPGLVFHLKKARTALQASTASLADQDNGDEYNYLDAARQKGADISSKLVLQGSGAERQFVAKGDMAQGQHIMTIPMEFSLSSTEGIQEIEKALDLTFNPKDTEKWSDDAWLSLWLALALKGLIPDSKLAFYTRSLTDQTPDTPVLWGSESEIQAALGREVAMRVLELRQGPHHCNTTMSS